MHRPRNKPIKIGSFAKRKHSPLVWGVCPRCGKPLFERTNSQTKESFIGCSGFPVCKYTLHVEKCRADYVGETFPNRWKPNYSSDALPLIERCASRPEIKYLFGAAYYLDFECGLSKTPLGLSLFKDEVTYEGKNYDAIRFGEPYQFWGGGTAPSAMAFVSQLEFAGRFHHDFGIFFAGDHAATRIDWWLGLAVEVDFHPSHDLFPTTDLYRDSLVQYYILRLKPEDDPLTWFSTVKRFWDLKMDT